MLGEEAREGREGLAHFSDPRTQEAEAGRPRVWGQLGLHTNTVQKTSFLLPSLQVCMLVLSLFPPFSTEVSTRERSHPFTGGTNTNKDTVSPQCQAPYVPTAISLCKIKMLSLGPPCLELQGKREKVVGKTGKQD